jgi:site-specific DNA-methyltransferase (adenine-specific)
MVLGDCIAGMRELADKSVDCVIMDPPYEAEAHTLGRRVKAAEREVVAAELPFPPITAAEREVVAAELVRVTKRWILVFCQVEGSSLWHFDLAKAGSQYVRTMVWIKPDGQPQLTGDRPGMGYESIVVAHPFGRKRWNGGGRTGVFVCNKNAGRPNGDPAPHPTTKPLPLMRELVELFTDPGELVLDAFAGSGTTGVACKQLGRRFLGFEKDPKYYEIACRRIAGERAKPHETQLDWTEAKR